MTQQHKSLGHLGLIAFLQHFMLRTGRKWKRLNGWMMMERLGVSFISF